MEQYTFRRDPATNALVAIDKSALAAYKARRDHARKLEDDINSLKDQLRQILHLLQNQNRG